MLCCMLSAKFCWLRVVTSKYITYRTSYLLLKQRFSANISAWQIANPHVAVCGFAICAPNLSVICGLKYKLFLVTNMCSNSNLYRIKNRLKNYSSAELCSTMLKFADWRFADQNKKIADFSICGLAYLACPPQNKCRRGSSLKVPSGQMGSAWEWYHWKASCRIESNPPACSGHGLHVLKPRSFSPNRYSINSGGT